MALCGTPWGNDVGDVWSQLRVVAPSVVPEGYWDFVQRYARLEVHRVARGRTVVKPVGVRDTDVLLRQVEPVWFRRSKESCLQLPPKTRRREVLALPPATRSLYSAVKRDGLAALGDELALDGAREVAMRLQQIAGGHRPEITLHRDFSGTWTPVPIKDCPKIAWLRDFVASVLAPDPRARALVWCQFVAEVERVTETLQNILGRGRVVACYGATPDAELAVAKASYQSRDPAGVAVLVCQYQKMSAGHDLYATSHAIYFSPTWSWLLRSQSEDRGHRIGSGGLQIVDLVAKATIDETVLARLGRKQDFSAQLLTEFSGWITKKI
jgi:SNF2 family DNA or RNA helicase